MTKFKYTLLAATTFGLMAGSACAGPLVIGPNGSFNTSLTLNVIQGAGNDPPEFADHVTIQFGGATGGTINTINPGGSASSLSADSSTLGSGALTFTNPAAEMFASGNGASDIVVGNPSDILGSLFFEPIAPSVLNNPNDAWSRGTSILVTQSLCSSDASHTCTGTYTDHISTNLDSCWTANGSGACSRTSGTESFITSDDQWTFSWDSNTAENLSTVPAVDSFIDEAEGEIESGGLTNGTIYGNTIQLAFEENIYTGTRHSDGTLFNRTAANIFPEVQVVFAVPEPGTLGVLGSGLGILGLGLVLTRRRDKNAVGGVAA